MKTILKSLFVAAVFMGIGAMATAQVSFLGTQETVNVNARILKKIVVDNQQPVAFGASQLGGGLADLNPIVQIQSVNVGFAAKPGRLVVDASPNEPIRIEFPLIVNLNQTVGGSGTIYYVPEIAGVFEAVTSDYGGATAVLLGNNNPPANQVASANSGPAPGLDNTGRGPFLLFQTPTGSEKSTLFIGGKITSENNTALWSGPFNSDNSAGTPPEVAAGTPTGTFVGTVVINFLYAL
jgi:hypothetical protein